MCKDLGRLIEIVYISCTLNLLVFKGQNLGGDCTISNSVKILQLCDQQLLQTLKCFRLVFRWSMGGSLIYSWKASYWLVIDCGSFRADAGPWFGSHKTWMEGHRLGACTCGRGCWVYPRHSWAATGWCPSDSIPSFTKCSPWSWWLSCWNMASCCPQFWWLLWLNHLCRIMRVICLAFREPYESQAVYCLYLLSYQQLLCGKDR